MNETERQYTFIYVVLTILLVLYFQESLGVARKILHFRTASVVCSWSYAWKKK